MGLFGWLADRWTPTYEYREYDGNEMEYIAWESTAAGSRRGFLLGFPAGALLTVAVIGGAVMTGLYTPPAQTVASREGQRGHSVAGHDRGAGHAAGREPGTEDASDASDHRVANHDHGAGRAAGREPGPEDASDGREHRVAGHDQGAGRAAGRRTKA